MNFDVDSVRRAEDVLARHTDAGDLRAWSGPLQNHLARWELTHRRPSAKSPAFADWASEYKQAIQTWMAQQPYMPTEVREALALVCGQIAAIYAKSDAALLSMLRRRNTRGELPEGEFERLSQRVKSNAAGNRSLEYVDLVRLAQLLSA